MQLCMDSADWFKSLVCEDGGGTGSSSPSAELLACPRPPALERRLRPQHDPALKCPRCDSTHTKFCYYNNYSLSQPRYFCKTCRRYWTKGGSLRNVPVGGGCRKNKRAAAKKPANDPLLHQPHLVPNFHDATDLHLSFASPQPPSPHLHSFADAPRNLNFMECKYNLMLNGPLTGSELMVGSSGGGSHLFMDSAEAAAIGDANHGLVQHNFSGAMNPFGFSMDGGHACLMDACQRLALPFDGHDSINVPEVKPGNKILSLEWPEQGSCGEVGRDAFGYSAGGLGLWTGMINSHGPSSTAI